MKKTTSTTTTKVNLSTTTSKQWFCSKKTRPKDFVVHFTRTLNGYKIRSVKALVKKNQYSSTECPIDAQTIAPDITRLGIIS